MIVLVVSVVAAGMGANHFGPTARSDVGVRPGDVSALPGRDLKPRCAWCFCVAPLTMFWANVHGGFLAGR